MVSQELSKRVPLQHEQYARLGGDRIRRSRPVAEQSQLAVEAAGPQPPQDNLFAVG